MIRRSFIQRLAALCGIAIAAKVVPTEQVFATGGVISRDAIRPIVGGQSCIIEINATPMRQMFDWHPGTKVPMMVDDEIVLVRITEAVVHPEGVDIAGIIEEPRPEWTNSAH